MEVGIWRTHEVKIAAPATPRSGPMCLNCGCGEPDERHQPTDITRDDFQRAADGSGISLEKAATNMTASLAKIRSSDRQESTAGPRAK